MPLPVYSVSLNVITSDDDTLDLLLDLLEDFALTGVKDLLSTNDPLATVMVTSSDGITIKC